MHVRLNSQDHDTSRPVGLSCGHHIALRDTPGSGKLHAKVYTINKAFCNEFHKYQGFSYGAFRKEDGNEGP